MIFVMLRALVNSSFWRIEKPPELVELVELVMRRGRPSLSQVKFSGRSPVATTHWTLVRSFTFRSLANANGVIFGGTVPGDVSAGYVVCGCAGDGSRGAHKLIPNTVYRVCIRHRVVLVVGWAIFGGGDRKGAFFLASCRG